MLWTISAFTIQWYCPSCVQHDVSGLLLLRCRIARASSALRSAFRPRIGWEESQAHFLYVYIIYTYRYIYYIRIRTHTLFVFVSQSFASVHFCFILFAFLCSQGALQHRPDFCPFAWRKFWYRLRIRHFICWVETPQQSTPDLVSRGKGLNILGGHPQENPLASTFLRFHFYLAAKLPNDGCVLFVYQVIKIFINQPVVTHFPTLRLLKSA